MYVLQVRAEHARMVSVYTATGSTQGNATAFTVLCTSINDLNLLLSVCLDLTYTHCTVCAFLFIPLLVYIGESLV